MIQTFAPSDLLTLEVFWSWTDEVLRLKSTCGFECSFDFVSQVGDSGYPVQLKSAAVASELRVQDLTYFNFTPPHWPSEPAAREVLEEFLCSQKVDPLRQDLLVEAYVSVVRQFLSLLYPYFNDQTEHHYSPAYARYCVEELRAMDRNWAPELGLELL